MKDTEGKDYCYYPRPHNEKDYHTIEGVCGIYGATPRSKGYLWDGAADVPGYSAPWRVGDSSEQRRVSYETSKEKASECYYMVWTPMYRHQGWQNTLSADETIITETRVNPDERQAYLEEAYLDLNIRRITFWRDTTKGAFRFIGVYVMDYPASLASGVRIYRRIFDEMPALKIKENQNK